MKKRREFLKKLGLGTVVGGLALASKTKNTYAIQTKKKYKWKMVTTWPKNFPGLSTGANLLAKRIEELSRGQIENKVFSAGELVPPLEVFNAVSSGIAELGHGAPYYWKGKTESAQFFAAVPFGLNAIEMTGWIYYGGAQKLWDDIYADFNLKPFAVGNTGTQMGGWFNKEINSLFDIKGLKMRIPGLGGEVLKEMGGIPVLLPGGKIFQALETKTIDATEWIGPYNDLAFGLYKVAKYYYWPGWHEPCTVLEMFINKKIYDSLPAYLQKVIEISAQASYQDMLADFTARNADSLNILLNKYNIKLRRFPNSFLKKASEISDEVIASLIKRDKASRKVYNSFNTFRKNSIHWNKVGELGFASARLI